MAKPRRPRRIRKTLPAHVRELVSVSLPLYVRKGQEKKWKEVAQRITKLLPRPEDAYRLLVRIFVALECASIHNRRSSERRRRAGDLKQIKKWSEKNDLLASLLQEPEVKTLLPPQPRAGRPRNAFLRELWLQVGQPAQLNNPIAPSDWWPLLGDVYECFVARQNEESIRTTFLRFDQKVRRRIESPLDIAPNP